MAVKESTSQPLIGKGWVQGVALVMIFGFFVMGLLAYRTYTASMPMPDKVVTESGQVVFTGDEITRGQELFQSRGLQEYGSIVGHGAYLGPDYTADYLRRATEDVATQLRDGGMADTHDAVVTEFRTNRFNPETRTLVFTDRQAEAFDRITQHYAEFFGEDSTKHGLLPRLITDPAEIHDLTAFFAWTAWASAADRPGHNYSYTNNWPSEPRVNNGPTAQLIVWSTLSLIMLLGGTGIMFAVYGRWSQKIGWHSAEAPMLSFRQPGEVPLTRAQRSTIWFFAIVSLLFLAQALLGGAVQHYRADLSNFFGLDLAAILPYNLARTWHLQLALLWTAAAFLAGGIFLTPFISRREPRRQHWLSYGLLGAVVIVVVGSLITEALSIYGIVPSGSLFSQQWEYLDLPRLWQILLIVGMFLWIAIIWRGMRARLKTESKLNMPWVFFFSGLAIPMFYAVGLLAGSDTHLTVADFWRFWVVHLWVEDFLELFTTVMVAYIFVMLGVVSQRIALGVIFLDVILYSAGGVIGTMHHLYFSGTPVEHMALGAFFSAAEVIPLTFLTVEAWAFLQLGSRQTTGDAKPFPHRWAVMFLVAVGFWNFVGAGIFGFLINLPIVSYYQIGTALTANHAHAAMMGVYGMLAVGLAMFAFRYVIPADKWPEKWARVSFWCLNIGLAWMVFASLLPLGVLQLYHSVNEGYFEARSLGYITQPGNAVLEWLRLPGDLIFIIGGVVPFVWIALQAVRHFKSGPTTDEMPENPLYTEVSPTPVPEAR
ncbi:nitric-oxide reductase large subunit [Mycolicibacterium fortuitum]|uniref:Nitric-oxide reductase subunit B n=1 Tax=Mycolicibacterium fortuitum subsp. fortuitum DSM 46621 = ATCC 6841 = JCM 6387 TaxID=1214102 RepID=K0VJQ0_MYCFO|nr:nitric-oxide reductase large subunit [Mycolicibacterium fortuitum]AIY47824.1 Nitric-oxide reductase, quinol-dependent [Mycobacterium sp. VKM Ac-1817D]CRL74849.1 nitric-oxide reductase subunit B [Mycolicibacter nonchromogenicus]EJZ15143.1 nitric-oxide reductase subunit B [Mycolicibacterium fortuitum subsp. fortuitum DSM 46621 = ATCC 6841 = JCM 6387]WEV31383.1 nitric-oxide reductase large subunit [Mycolicibacterium fortuitum]CRL58760.1 nitric-oxide reductase subunit B [Mycolicibacterium fortu